jgi:hypothetical protein
VVVVETEIVGFVPMEFVPSNHSTSPFPVAEIEAVCPLQMVWSKPT